MKRHVWIEGRKLVDSIEIIVRDGSKRKLESWIIAVNDKKRARQIMKTLKESYGVDFSITMEEDLKWMK